MIWFVAYYFIGLVLSVATWKADGREFNATFCVAALILAPLVPVLLLVDSLVEL